MLAAGAFFASPTHAQSQSIEEQQRQILFESLLYDGGIGPNLRDKHPTAETASEAPETLLPEVTFEDHGQQTSAPVESVAVTPSPPPAQPARYKIVPTAAAYSAPSAAPVQHYTAPNPVPPFPQPPPSTVPGNDLYRRAKVGDPDAEYQLGMLFTQDRAGRDVNPYTSGRANTEAVARSAERPENTRGASGDNTADQSYYWFTQAARKGHKRAQYNLGVMHAQGEGTVQNLIEAYIWFNLAAARHMEGAMEARDMVATSLTPDALIKAQERSTFYQQKIAQNIAQMGKSGPAAVISVR